MKTAWLFPGQGTDLAELPREALEQPGPVRRLLECASSVVGLDLTAALRAGNPLVWKTEFGQPALVAVTLGLADEKEQDQEDGPDAVAGHSLGELAAAAFAGCLAPEDAIAAAAARGRAMAEAAKDTPGGMVAVRCENDDAFAALLDHGRRFGALAFAARNSPTQWVVSGARPALDAVLAKARGVSLAVTGPWHTPAMAAAATAWEPTLRAFRFSPPRRRLMLTGRAEFAAADTDVAAALLAQLTAPVLWGPSVAALLEAGISRLVALGPGRALRGLSREIAGATSPTISVEAA